MSTRTAAVLAFLFLFTAAAQATDPYAEIASVLNGGSYFLEIDDGAPQPTLVAFSSIDRSTGTFRVSVTRPRYATTTVPGRFTFVPALSFGTFRVPARYQMSFRVPENAFRRTTYTAELYLLPEEPRLTGCGSRVTDGFSFGGSRTPVVFTAERVVIPQ